MVNRVALPVIKGARSGDPAAQLALGRMYLEGSEGLRRDLASAYYWLKKAAAGGITEAAHLIGAAIPEALVTDPVAAAPLYEEASRRGNANAALALADWLAAGVLCDVNGDTALGLIRRAAEQGDRRAQLRLAMLYQHGGDIVPRDEGEAMYWFERAAELGSTAAQIALAEHLWRTGDPAAMKWLRAVAKMGDPQTCFRYGSLLLADGRADEAVLPLELAAAQGHAEAQLSYGLLHAASGRSKVRGIPHSYKRTVHWLEKASRQGLAQASFELSRLYRLRTFSMRDAAMARRYEEKAAEQGHAHAQYLTGRAYWRLRLEPDADVTSVNWLVRAARQGHAEAGAMLHRVCVLPRAVPGDVLQARSAAVRSAAKFNLALSVRLELASAFGLERHEMLLLRPELADREDCLLIDVRAERRSARRRVVPILAPANRAALDRAIQLLGSAHPHPDDVRGPLRARQRVLDAALEKLGVEWSLFVPGK